MMTSRNRHHDKETSTWEFAFVSHLREGDVSGVQIGDALEQVRSHCADTGQSPAEAFGDPVTYAASLPLRRRPVRLRAVEMFSTVAGLLGLMLTTSAVQAIVAHRGVELRAGRMMLALLGLVLLAAFMRNGSRLVSQLAARPLLVGLAVGAAIGLGVLAALLQGPVVATLPASLVLGAGVLLLIASTVNALRNPVSADPVLSPVSDNSREVRQAKGLQLVLAFMFPVSTVALAAVMLLAG